MKKRSAVWHWWAQRLSGILLVPLGCWGLYFFLYAVQADRSTLLEALHSPYRLVPLLLCFTLLIYHAVLGGIVIVQDYLSLRYQAFGIHLFKGLGYIAEISVLWSFYKL